MSLVDYSDDDSSSGDETPSPRNWGGAVKPGFDGEIKPAGRKVEIKPVEITPGGKRFEQEPDLAVLAALAGSKAKPPKESLKRKLAVDLAPENKSKKAEPATFVETPEDYTDAVHAIGGGRHQLSSLIRNAVDNKSALEAQFSRDRQARQARTKKYGF